MSRAVIVLLAVARFAHAADFNHDVAPIIYQHCASCHRPGEAGPFSLLTYQDVKSHAHQIADVTRRRFMPPWLPEHGFGDFSGEQRLSDAEIRTLAEWAAAGAPEGNGAAPTPPQFIEGWQLGTPDLIVEAKSAYTLRASGPDVYWNFIFTPDLKTTRFVRAIEIRPGAKKLVHHANLYVDRARSARRQEPSPGAGFSGMDPIIERSAFDPDDGHFLFWKPGSGADEEPDGFSWRLDPGNDLVLNAHLQPSGKSEQVRPIVGIYFTDKPQTKFPVLLQLEHDGALKIPAGARDFIIADDFHVPLDCDVLAVYPHAHYLGKLLDAYATLPSGEKKPLIRIRDWDPNWQAVYRYREPVFLPKGAVISMRYHYDNSAANPRNPNRPPKLVEAGNQATDEMGHLWLQILPRTGGDRRMVFTEALLRHRIEKYPRDPSAHLHLGAILLARLNPNGALTELQTAAHLEPKNPEARNLLGSALSASGRTREAIIEFRAAVELRPDYPNARFNLANALMKSGQTADAIAEYRKIIAAHPDDALVRTRLEEALAMQKEH